MHRFPGQLTELFWSQAQNVADLRAQVHVIGEEFVGSKVGVLSVPFLCRSEMKRWMTSLAPNRRTKFVSFTSRLLGESLT